MNGGYVMVDCDNLDLTKGSTEQTINGLYDRITAAMATGKPIVANGCIWGTDGPVTPFNIFCVQFSGYVTGAVSTLQVTVTNEDVVTIEDLAPQG